MVKRRKAITPEERENQLCALAVNLVEKRLQEGTASSAEILHYLKRASTKERLEEEILREQKKLVQAKTSNLEYEKQREQDYAKVIEAIREYSGYEPDEEIE
jgi:Na+-translocating ferredoxin:NAD+ oxidoreductase RnfG subunit